MHRLGKLPSPNSPSWHGSSSCSLSPGYATPLLLGKWPHQGIQERPFQTDIDVAGVGGAGVVGKLIYCGTYTVNVLLLLGLCIGKVL